MAKLFTIYAAPATWGPKVQIQSVFGENVWCKFAVDKSIAVGPIVFQYWSSETKTWRSTQEGQVLKGQSVWLSAKSTGTGGEVTISVSGTAIYIMGKKVLLRVPVVPKSTQKFAVLRFSTGVALSPVRAISILDMGPDGSVDQDNFREFTPVDGNGDPSGPSFDVDFGSPNTSTNGEMEDGDGNAASDPFDIPDYIPDAPNDSNDAPSDGPSDATDGGDGGGD